MERLISFKNREDALKELGSLKKELDEINNAFRPIFKNLSGPILLDCLETDKDFSKSLEVLCIYAYTQNSKNMNDKFFSFLLSDSQDLVTNYKKANSFATLKLTSLDKKE